jgi:hypothetical protein
MTAKRVPIIDQTQQDQIDAVRLLIANGCDVDEKEDSSVK